MDESCGQASAEKEDRLNRDLGKEKALKAVRSSKQSALFLLTARLAGVDLSIEQNGNITDIIAGQCVIVFFGGNSTDESPMIREMTYVFALSELKVQAIF